MAFESVLCIVFSFFGCDVWFVLANRLVSWFKQIFCCALMLLVKVLCLMNCIEQGWFELF